MHLNITVCVIAGMPSLSSSSESELTCARSSGVVLCGVTGDGEGEGEGDVGLLQSIPSPLP